MKFGIFLMILALIASAAAVLSVLYTETDASSAQFDDSGRCGDDMTYSLTDGTLVISGKGGMYDYFENSAPWNKYGGSVTKVVIEDGVTSLGEWAFHGCMNIRELTIPGSLNSVRSNSHAAFAGCVNIEKVNITYGTNGTVFDYDAYPVNDRWYQNTPWYQSRNVLKEINFADGIKGIGSDAFRELNITSVAIPDSVAGFGNHTFYNCAKLTELTYPISLRPFCDEKYPAFHGCGAIQKVTLTNGNGVPYDYCDWEDYPQYGNLAPWNMNPDITKTVVIADNVSKLGRCMFWGCNLKELTIPVSINLEDDFAFDPIRDVGKEKNYKNLEKLTFTKGSGRGCDYEFYDQDGKFCPWHHATYLDSVTLEEGVTHIGEQMFCSCKIGDLTIRDANISFGSSAFRTCAIKHLTIPISVNATWRDVNVWTISYDYPAFYEIAGIEKIDFTPGSGYGFDYDAHDGNNRWYQNTPWYQCRDTLKEINFAEGITHIGSDAFRELNITSLVIPNSVKSLGNHAFYNLKNLSSLTLPITLDSVGSTEYPAFDKDDNITKVRYTAGTDGIGHDYSDAVPYWNYPFNSGFTVIFDSNIKYIGTNTLSAYYFTGEGGVRLEPTAENLSGCIFQGTLTPRLAYVCESWVGSGI